MFRSDSIIILIQQTFFLGKEKDITSYNYEYFVGVYFYYERPCITFIRVISN